MEQLWTSKDNLLGLVFSFYHTVLGPELGLLGLEKSVFTLLTTSKTQAATLNRTSPSGGGIRKTLYHFFLIVSLAKWVYLMIGPQPS